MNDWTEAGELGGRALGGIVRIVADTHRAITARVDTFLPPVAKPFNQMHGAAADAVYAIVEAAHEQAPRVASRFAQGDPTDHSVIRTLQPVVNGFHGDLVERDHPGLAIPMTARVEGERTPHLVVFVHGLAEDDTAWGLGGRPSYGQRLRDDGFAPVFVRYNTGRHISDNGRDLAELLDALVADQPVDSISLVGHSMGGLVARSACYAGGEWTQSVRAVVTLGTPHRGAPLEKVVHVLDSVMRKVPEAEPIGRILANRSVGVKDLRLGSLVEEDWRDQDVDEFLHTRCAEVPFLPHARYYWLAATLTRDPRHPMGRLIGDGMVRLPSASAVEGEGLHLGELGHLGLLNDEKVFAALRKWLQ